MLPKLLLPTLTVLLLILPSARAEIVIYEFTSTVNYVQNLPVAGISPALGDLVSGYFCYDRTAVDQDPGDPSHGLYMTGHMVLNVDGHTVYGDFGRLDVYNISPPNDLFGFAAGVSQSGVPLVVDGLTVNDIYAGLFLDEFGGSVINDDSLPTVAQLSQLQISQFNLFQTGNRVILYDNVTVTNVAIADPAISSIVDVGNDQGRNVRLDWDAAALDRFGSLRPITEYAIYRRIEGGLKTPPGDWDFVAGVPATAEGSYHAVVPTLCDSTPLEDCFSTFFVRARTATLGVHMDSATLAGASVDNLAPAVPSNLTLNLTGSLTWDESPEVDFEYYSIYASSDALLDGGDVILGYATSPDFDVSGSGAGFFLVTATDFNANEGGAAAIANSAVSNPGSQVAALTLESIRPNPARGLTSIVYALPRAAIVEAAIYDAAGRRVRDLGNGTRPSGSNLLSWDGRDDASRDVAAGVYFVRIRAANEESTGRILRMR